MVIKTVCFAHIRASDQQIQTVREHCHQVSERAQGYANAIQAAQMGKLQGLLHDIGKLSPAFAAYISGQSTLRRGEIAHIPIWQCLK